MSRPYPPPERRRPDRSTGRSTAGSPAGRRRDPLPVPPPTHRSAENRANRAAGSRAGRRDGSRTAEDQGGLARPSRIAPAAVLDRPTSPVPAIRMTLDHELPIEPEDRGIPGRLDRAPGTSILGTRTLDMEPVPSPAAGSSRWLVRGSILVGVALTTAGLALSLPRILRSGSDGDGTGTHLETADRPVASAALLRSESRLEVAGSLTDSGGLSSTTNGAGTTSAASSELTVSETTSGAAPGSSGSMAPTTTSTWVEPTLPPQAEWVDAGNGVSVPDLLLRIRFCESTNDYTAVNRASSARGAYQFLTSSWEWYGHAERTGAAQAHLATPAQQDEAALLTLQSEGTDPWVESRPCWSDPDIDPRYATASPPPKTTAPPASTTTTEATGTSTTGGGGSTTSTDPSSTTTPSTTTSTSSSSTTTTEPSSTTTTEPSSTTTSTTA